VVGVRGTYYNEFDPNAAAWLRELIKRGLIAPGEVDERSISDVTPDDLSGFVQHHFFAGIGGWSLALRLAGWPDDRPVWTGSCPCQPFSSAGKGAGFADERHLWPHWNWLIEKCHPATVFGEQVASKDGLGWFDLVSADLEGQGYAVGASDMCAAGFGAPHIRQRLWFVGLADASNDGRHQGRQCIPSIECDGSMRNGPVIGLADTDDTGPQGRIGMLERTDQRAIGSVGMVGRLADTECLERGTVGVLGLREIQGAQGSGSATEFARSGGDRITGTAPIDSPWRDADWLYCRDGKWRAVEPDTFPLAHGVSDRVVRLRGYGNAIVPQVAAEWIKAVMTV
jgi:DNA (cytosine-5)-methyltransferase 1